MDKLMLLVVLKIKQLSDDFIASDAIIIIVAVAVVALYSCLLELILALTSSIL